MREVGVKMRKARILAALLAAVLLFGSLSVAEATENSDIKLIVDGQEKSLTAKIFALNNGTVYVPLVETFAHLGVTMTKNNDLYTGKGNNGEIIIEVGKSTAEVDWVDIELPAPVIERSGQAMVPAYLIEDAVKTEPAVYDAEKNTLSVVSPDPDDVYEEAFDIGNIAHTLPAGEKIFSQEDLYAANTSHSYLEVTKNVPVDIDGYTDAIEIKTLAMPYGEVPAVTAIGFTVSAKGKQDMEKGDVALIHFKARATDTSDESGTANLMMFYERMTDWNKMGTGQWAVSRDNWQDYYLPIYATEMGTTHDPTWPANKSYVKICIGGKPQTIQIAGFEVIYYGSDKVDISQLRPDSNSPYQGMSEDALWRKEAYRRIEKYRKEDVSVSVLDTDGNPIEGATVEVNQTENDFIFGIAICNDEILNLDTSTVGGKIQNEVIDSFNTGVCGLEMKAPYIDKYAGALGVEMTNEFFRRGKRMKGHALIWDSDACLDFISETANRADLSYEEIYRRVFDYVLPTAYLFRGKLTHWDVLNEPHDSNFIRKTYGTRLYADIFNAVHEIDPEVKLYVNETGIAGKDKGMSDRIPALIDIVKGMQNEGAHIDGIGIQAHCVNYHYPQGFYRQLDECAQIVDEVAITEYDFFNENMDYADEHLRDSLLATFSHPKSSAFVMWGYYDRIHWRGCAPFYDKDWNEKPAKAVWDRMVKEEFKTKLSLTTGKSGKADFRGFHGDYEITVKYNGKEKKIGFGLKKDAENYINITVGNNISAEVSSEKFIIVPSPIEYETLDDSTPEFREEYNPPYISLMIESKLRGTAADSLVANGGNPADSSSYNDGKKWGSQSGMLQISTDSAYGMVFNNSAEGSFSMSHRQSGNVFDKGNLELSFKVDTFSSRQDGFSLDMALMQDENVSLGRIKTTADGYLVETLSGAEIKLSDNSIYDIYITLTGTKKPSVYDIKYVIKKGELAVKEVTEKQSVITALSSTDGIVLTADCSGADSRSVLRVQYARLKFYTTDYILNFSPVGITAELLNDSMTRFDTSTVVTEEDSSYLSGESWGSNTSDIGNSFAYLNEGKYLYGIRTDQTDEQRLKKNLGTLYDGDELKLEFDYYINAPYKWFNSNGYFDIRLESADSTVQRTLISHEYAKNNFGFRVVFLADADYNFAKAEVVEWGDVSKHNRNNLHITCRIFENESGKYDAVMKIKNAENIETDAEYKNFLTKAEFLKLNTFVIANRTLAAGTRYGEAIAGIKNIVITKSGRDARENGEAPEFMDGDTVGIEFKNMTAKPFDATIIFAGYKDGRLVSVSTGDYKDRSDEEGFLSARVLKSDADSYKVLLLNGSGDLVPVRAAEDILVK